MSANPRNAFRPSGRLAACKAAILCHSRQNSSSMMRSSPVPRPDVSIQALTCRSRRLTQLLRRFIAQHCCGKCQFVSFPIALSETADGPHRTMPNKRRRDPQRPRRPLCAGLPTSLSLVLLSLPLLLRCSPGARVPHEPQASQHARVAHHEKPRLLYYPSSVPPASCPRTQATGLDKASLSHR